MADKKNIECRFATITSTGERPDAEIHIVGFTDEEGISTVNQIAGHGRDLAQVLSSAVANLAKHLEKEDSRKAAAAFINIVTHRAFFAVDEHTRELATVMADVPNGAQLLDPEELPEELKDKLMENLGELASQLGIEDEDEDDE